MSHPEGGDNLPKENVQTDQPKVDQPVQEQISPDVSQTNQAVEEGQELSLEEPQDTTDKFHGKSREDVIKVNENLQKLLEEQSRQITEQSRTLQTTQVRTQGPDRIPQTVPQVGTQPTQQLDMSKLSDAVIEGNTEQVNQILNQHADNRFDSRLSQVVQYSQALDQQQKVAKVGEIRNSLANESKLISAETGVSADEIYTSVVNEYEKDPALKAELESNPFAFTDERVRQGARELFGKHKSSRKEKLIADLKDVGYDVSQVKNLKKITKEVANTTVPDSNSVVEGDQKDSQFTKEQDEKLKSLGI